MNLLPSGSINLAFIKTTKIISTAINLIDYFYELGLHKSEKQGVSLSVSLQSAPSSQGFQLFYENGPNCHFFTVLEEISDAPSTTAHINKCIITFHIFLQPLYKYFKHKLKQRNCAPSLSLRLIAAWPNRVLLVKFYDVSNRKVRSFPHKNAFVNFIILTIGKHAAPCVSIISVSIWKAP